MAYLCEEPFHRWTYRVDKLPVAVTSDEEQARTVVEDEKPVTEVSLDVHAVTKAPVWRGGGLLPEAREARKSVVSALEGARLTSGLSPLAYRCEQVISAQGTITFEGTTYDFNGVGLRVHSRGVRDTSKLYGHTWIHALFSDGRAIGLMQYPRPGGGYYSSEALVFQDGKVYPNRIIYAPPMSRDPHEDGYVIELACDELGLTRIEGRDVRVFWWVMGGNGGHGVDPNAPMQMRQGITRLEWDGVVGFGLNERSGS